MSQVFLYIDFLMPGIFVQTVVFGALTTGVGLAEDLQKGLVERFRSLPMARSAVLVGRTLADLVRNVFVVLLMCVVGFLVGWRIQTNVFGFLGAVGLVIAFAYSLSWVFAIVGLSAPDAETAQAASFPILAPARVRVLGVRAGGDHARLAAGLRQPSAGDGGGERGASAHPRRADQHQGDPGRRCGSSAIIATCAPLAVARYRRVT